MRPTGRAIVAAGALVLASGCADPVEEAPPADDPPTATASSVWPEYHGTVPHPEEADELFGEDRMAAAVDFVMDFRRTTTELDGVWDGVRVDGTEGEGITSEHLEPLREYLSPVGYRAFQQGFGDHFADSNLGMTLVPTFRYDSVDEAPTARRTITVRDLVLVHDGRPAEFALAGDPTMSIDRVMLEEPTLEVDVPHVQVLHGTTPGGEPAALTMSYDTWSVHLLPHDDSWHIVGWSVGGEHGPGDAIDDPGWEPGVP